jgi:WD40 repeat protein
LASGDNDGEIKLWDVQSSTCLTTLPNGKRSVGALAFSSGESLLISSSSDEIVTLWNVEKGEKVPSEVVERHMRANWARAMAFNRDGTMLATGGDRHTVRIWQIDQQKSAVSLRMFSRGGGQVWSVAFSPDHRLLASGDDDGTLVVWDMETGTCRQVLRSDRPYERLKIRGLTGITEAQRVSLTALGAIEES